MSVADDPPGQFRCQNGRLVALSLVLDGIDDCDDGSDEIEALGEFTVTLHYTIQKYENETATATLPARIRKNCLCRVAHLK